MSESNSVAVPRGLLVALAILLVGSLMAVAYLMGRQSSPAPVVTVAAAPAPAPPLPPVVDAPAALDPVAVAASEGPEAAAPTATARGGVVAAHSASSPAPTKQRHAPLSPAVAKAVASYFSKVDKIQPGELTDDPNAFANQIVQGALNGDTSGLDKVINQTQQSRQRLAALVPPTPCTGYHASSLKLMGESVQVLRHLESGLKSNDAGSLSAIAGEAQSMQTEAQLLKTEETSLKSQYGIP